ncbi:MAG: xanthine dehydrogenase family protein subunit M [Anaerolineae bacterium]|nr:xanthine dehydrogenase family protein subunit M [Anaerolineae bacterium]NIN98255.1 xanthine dehydrogenase family protein subunit M [Anaerolineae bacterium]NIQ81182.1 xanthine dehydrogenase family protein subunit M [Anaerolineae bacterium]
MWDDYLFPQSVEEALEMLETHGGQARIIAGGTDLVIQSERGRIPARVIVDITRIPGLSRVEERDGFIYVGAQVTHAQVAASASIKSRANVLAEACGSVGGLQIRNVGTLVGNVVNALPAADGAIALFALDAEAEVAERTGRRWTAIADLYAGVGRCTVDSCEAMITQLRFPALGDGEAGAFERLAKRKALILPILNAAVVVGLDGGKVKMARIAVGPVATTPFVAAEAAESLIGAVADQASIAEAALLASQAAQPRDSLLRGSAEYRKSMVEVLVRRALTRAVARASGEEG